MALFFSDGIIVGFAVVNERISLHNSDKSVSLINQSSSSNSPSKLMKKSDLEQMFAQP